MPSFLKTTMSLLIALAPVLSAASTGEECETRLEGRFSSEGYLTDTMKSGLVFLVDGKAYVTERMELAPHGSREVPVAIARRLTRHLKYDPALNIGIFRLEGGDPRGLLKFYHVIGRASFEYPRQPVIEGRAPHKDFARYDNFDGVFESISRRDLIRVAKRKDGGIFFVSRIEPSGVWAQRLDPQSAVPTGEPRFLRLTRDGSDRPVGSKVTIIGKMEPASTKPVLFRNWRDHRHEMGGPRF